MEVIIMACIVLLTVLPIILVVGGLAIASYILEGIAFTRLQKNKPVKYLWLVWVPYVNYIGKMHLLAHLSNETEVRMFCNRLTFKRKITPWKISFVTYIIGTLVSGLGLATVWIPFVGPVSFGLESLILIPAGIWFSLVEYAYLRDLLNTLKPGNSSNVSTAVWVTIGNLFTCGLVRGLFLYKLAKEQMHQDTAQEDAVKEPETETQTEDEFQPETETEQETEILETAE